MRLKVLWMKTKRRTKCAHSVWICVDIYTIQSPSRNSIAFSFILLTSDFENGNLRFLLPSLTFCRLLYFYGIIHFPLIYIYSLLNVLSELNEKHSFISQDSQTIRTLTLISKTIQSLGNLVSSRSSHQHAKEEFMADLYKKFCTEKHVRAVKEFLDAISTKGMMESLSNSCYSDEAILLKDG